MPRFLFHFFAILALVVTAGCATRGGDPNAASPVGPDKVVYHVSDARTQGRQALRNASNHLDVNPEAKIVIVTLANGVDFLMEGAKDANNNPYLVEVQDLKARGVQFDVCMVTMRNRDLKKEQFISEVTFVPSGVVELGKLQSRFGYAYIRP